MPKDSFSQGLTPLRHSLTDRISGGERLGVETGRDELRDALAALYADGNQAGVEAAADMLRGEYGGYDEVNNARHQLADEGREYFLTEWNDADGGRSNWTHLQRVLDAIDALPRSASIPKTGFGNL